MSTEQKVQLTEETAALLSKAQTVLSKMARAVLPAESAAEFEAHMAADRKEKFVEVKGTRDNPLDQADVDADLAGAPRPEDCAEIIVAQSSDGLTADQVDTDKMVQAVVMLLEATHAPDRLIKDYLAGDVGIEVHLEEVTREEAKSKAALAKVCETIDQALESASDENRGADATYAYLKALDTPQDVLDGFRAGDLVAHVSVEMTPA